MKSELRHKQFKEAAVAVVGPLRNSFTGGSPEHDTIIRVADAITKAELRGFMRGKAVGRRG